MHQVKYLISASLILIACFLLYLAAIPLSRTAFVDHEDQFYCGTASMSAPAATSYPEGKKLFQQNCQSCHALDKNITGPALRGFTTRGPWGSREEIYKWVHNPAQYMKKDQYTRAL